MIRVIQAGPGESFAAARARPPQLTAVDAAALTRQLDPSPFDVSTTAAVKRALRELTLGSADVVVAPGAGLYKVYPSLTNGVEVAAPVRESVRWSSEEPGGVVVVAGRLPVLARVVEALRFVGYDARLAPAGDTRSLAASLVAHRPLVTFLGAENGGALDPEALAACRALGSAVVLLHLEAPGLGVAPGSRAHPEGVDAVLELPFVTGRIAELVDPLVRAARGRRASA